MKVCQGDAHGGFCLTEVLSCRCWVTIRNEFVVEVKMECFQNSWGNPPHEDLFTWDVCKISATKWSACCSFVVVTSSLAISWYIYIYIFLFLPLSYILAMSAFQLDTFFSGVKQFFAWKNGQIDRRWPAICWRRRLTRRNRTATWTIRFYWRKYAKKYAEELCFRFAPMFFPRIDWRLDFFFLWGGWADEWARFECQLVKGLAGFKFEWWGRGCVLAGIVSISMGVDICVICWLF